MSNCCEPVSKVAFSDIEKGGMNKLGMALYIALCSLDGLVGGYPLDIIVEARTGSLVSADSRLFLVSG